MPVHPLDVLRDTKDRSEMTPVILEHLSAPKQEVFGQNFAVVELLYRNYRYSLNGSLLFTVGYAGLTGSEQLIMRLQYFKKGYDFALCVTSAMVFVMAYHDAPQNRG